MSTFFALTTRGLEAISADEIGTLKGATGTETAYRRVTVDFDGDPNDLLSLRTVDDLFIYLTRWTNVGRPRSTLRTLKEQSAALDLRDAAALCGEVRTLGTPPTFSVTASFVGKRNYTNEEIKLAVAEGVEATHGWEYFSDDAVADLNLRVFVEHEQAFVGVRLGQKALHLRPYATAHVRGALKPPIAAAMVQLAKVAPAQVLLDPCCGAGHIVIEAALMGFAVQGGDERAEAVAAAQTNVRSAGVDTTFQQWNLASLPLAPSSIARIVTHLSFENELAADDALTERYATVIAEFQRVLTTDGRAVLLTATPQLALQPPLRLIEQIEISLFGQPRFILVLGA